VKSVSFSVKSEKPKVSREQALRVARQLGCRGAHENPDGGWMPCATHEQFEALKRGKKEYLRVSAQERKVAETAISRRTRKVESKSAEYYKDRRMALEASKRNGCSTVRIVNLGGERYYAPCVTTDKFEELNEGGIVGIDTISGGGLVSAQISKEDDISDIDSKGFVNFVSRSTDPDVFTNPDSARIRARNLGCIGIRRYTAKDGKTVWLPCSNGSDYNRSMGIRGDNMPRKRGRNRKDAQEALSLSLNQVKEVNRPKRKTPTIDSETVNMLAVRVRQHNAKVSDPMHRTNLRDIKIVYMRGLAVGEESDALKRVNTFFRAMASNKPLPKGTRTDFDLVPANHPSKDPKNAKKDGRFDDGEIGVKRAKGCCPAVVKRYRKI